MRNRDEFKDIEVLGSNLGSILGGFGSFTLLASKILLEESLGTDDGTGHVKFEPKTWYSLQRFLGAFDRIGHQFGDQILRQVGMSIPRNAVFPPWVGDVDSAIRSIDIAYHMNHAIRGEPMYSPSTGEMREGIGHYGYQRVPGRNVIISECTGPYPCAFDQGILMAMSQRFQPMAVVTHDTVKPCRKNGGASCVYQVSWK